ncbi:hypothetical protein K1T71_000634 [Dendrolimus kikuchii]|uniref:Uncharacterized protein n=1 Tax=Dendrolimus kikuchii TaxID=765133 RepID=A0ACC1DJY5_9NEOP|nr:hypothetical protein K1T71_000634 [Dendrolimus kikuchii]
MAEAASNDGLILFVDAETGAECFQVNLGSADLVSVDQGTLAKKKLLLIKMVSSDAYTVEGDRYRCKQCTRYTSYCVEKMKRHIRKVHEGLNPYKCSLCEYSTYNSVLFQEHVWIHEGVKPYECAFCKYRSVSKKNLKKHELIHRPNYPLRCKKCKYIARHNRALKCHMQETHGTQDNEKEANAKKKQEDGEKIVCLKRCTMCEKVLCKSELNQHMLGHGVAMIKSGRKVKKYVFTCQICKWMGSSKPKILLHLIHHPNQDLNECKVDLSVLRECGILPAA